jgi:hypothetical protein
MEKLKLKKKLKIIKINKNKLKKQKIQNKIFEMFKKIVLYIVIFFFIYNKRKFNVLMYYAIKLCLKYVFFLYKNV